MRFGEAVALTVADATPTGHIGESQFLAATGTAIGLCCSDGRCGCSIHLRLDGYLVGYAVLRGWQLYTASARD